MFMDNISGPGSINPNNSLKADSANKNKTLGPNANESAQPNKQVIPASSHSNSVIARIHSPNAQGPSPEHEIDIEALGLVKVSDSGLEAFANRVAQGILTQEQAIINTARAFSGGNKDAMASIISALAA
jgi:hypothetical protein